VNGPGKGDKRGYSWPDAEAGNRIAEVHGSRSERTVGPRAAEVERRLLADPDTPDHLRRPEFGGAVTAYARAQAVADQVFDHLSERDMAAALAEVTREAGEEDSTVKGKVRRVSVSRRTVSALDAWFRASAHAAALRAKLGLDPVSAGRLAKDLSAARWYGVTPLDKALERIAAERQAAIEAGGDGG